MGRFALEVFIDQFIRFHTIRPLKYVNSVLSVLLMIEVDSISAFYKRAI